MTMVARMPAAGGRFVVFSAIMVLIMARNFSKQVSLLSTHQATWLATTTTTTTAGGEQQQAESINERLARIRRSAASSVRRRSRKQSARNETAAAAATTTKQPWLTAVLVEIRCHAALALVLEQALRHLDATVSIHVWHAAENALYVQHVINGTSPWLRQEQHRLVLRELDPTIWGFVTHRANVYGKDYWYSRLLTSAAFYQTIATPYVLTMQSDTLLCGPFSDRHWELVFPTTTTTKRFNNNTKQDAPAMVVPFLGGSAGIQRRMTLVGRAVRRNTTEIAWKDNPSPDLTSLAHLNGGLSLRHVAWTLECIQRHGNQTLWVEDDLFNYCLQEQQRRPLETQTFALASDEGKTLCFDDNKDNNNNNRRLCPVGVHKPWTKGQRSWAPFQLPTPDWDDRYRELQSHCPGLGWLPELQYVHQQSTTTTTTTTTTTGDNSSAGNCTVRGMPTDEETTTTTTTLSLYEIPCHCPRYEGKQPALQKRRRRPSSSGGKNQNTTLSLHPRPHVVVISGTTTNTSRRKRRRIQRFSQQ